MRIATWNVNSLTARLPHVLDWLAAGRVTVSAEGRVLLDGSDHPSSRTLIHPLLAGLSSTGGSGF